MTSPILPQLHWGQLHCSPWSPILKAAYASHCLTDHNREGVNGWNRLSTPIFEETYCASLMGDLS